MLNNGWIKLHRKIEENFLWFSESFTKAQAFIDLILNANHKPGTFNIRGNIIKLTRGQIGWSELTMMKRWSWSKNKVRRFLKLLETEHQIEQQKLAKLTTIITILNYNSYQNDTTDDTTEGLQKDYRRYTNKNDKNDKNEKNNTCSSTMNDEDFIAFYTAYPKKKSKEPAKKAFKRLSKELLPIILSSLAKQKETEQWKKDKGQFIPLPSTWINQKRWEDEIENNELLSEQQQKEKDAKEMVAKYGQDQAMFPFSAKYGDKAILEFKTIFGL